MDVKRVDRRPLMGVALLLTLSGGACVDEEIVYRDRVLFEEPVTAAQGMLGYSDSETKLTVCGNCHVGMQGEWEETAHADAWVDLQDSGNAQEFCEGCHTVNEAGNFLAEAAGHTAAPDERYYDVQCEACHGPGLTHVTNPDASVPLASLAVGAELTNGCGECHAGSHNPFIEEWSLSRHGEGASRPQYRNREDGGCQNCHGGKPALEAWGIDVEYIEKDDPTQVLGITCGVCHDPHDATNSSQLRFPIDVPDVERNLCMQCHQKRAIPDEGSSSRGPHSPQGPLLLGEDVGWIPPNFAYDQQRIRGTHGSEKNARLCAGCHVNRVEVVDELTGEEGFSTGHLFKAIPCVDETGLPTPSDDCGYTTEERSFASCSVGGCHGDATAALSAFNTARDRIDELAEELDALLALVPEDQFSSADTLFTTGEGANFNLGLAEIESSAIHNPFLTEALLRASIRQVRDDYELAAQSSVSLEALLGRGIR